MDECGKQMQENAVACAHISSLIENVIKVQIQSKKCPELKTLKEKCCSDNIGISYAAFQGITRLVEKKILIGSQTISSLISALPSVTHYSPLIIAIGNILLFDLQEQVKIHGKYEPEYNFTDKAHPFVIILKHNAEKSWDSIYSYIQFLLFKCQKINYTYKINSLQTVFLYTLCNPMANSIHHKNELFSLLLREHEKPKITYFIFQCIAWQSLDISFCWLIYKVCQCYLTSPYADSAMVIAALTPHLAVVVKWLILNGHNPNLWIDLLSASLKINSDGANAALYIISDVILQTPALFINDVVDLCKSIICSGNCNKYVAHKLAGVALIWLVNPSTLAEPVFKNLEYIIKYLNLKMNQWNKLECNLSGNPYYSILRNSNNDVKLSVEMTKLSNSWDSHPKILLEWLQILSKSDSKLMQKNLLPFISGIVLCENDDEIVDVAVEILLNVSKSYSEVSFFQLCLIFFNLSRETEPTRQLRYLQLLTKMANSKENIPLIIGIVETLRNDTSPTMTSVVIDMYLKLWKVDSRTYAHLHKALFTTSSQGESSWEINVMKTIALKEICTLFPETYGKSLVPKLSEILNECNNYSSGIPSALAIEAVIELCKAHVTDVTGTWKALKPKLGQDQRADVVMSLCKLFSEIPGLKAPGAERDALICDVIPRLFKYALSQNLEVIKAALKSLSKFSSESYGPKLLPDVLKSNIKIPKQYCKASTELTNAQILEELQYVPGKEERVIDTFEVFGQVKADGVTGMGCIRLLSVSAISVPPLLKMSTPSLTKRSDKSKTTIGVDTPKRECWIEFMKQIQPEALEDAGNMLIALGEEELTSLPRRYFYHPEEMPEPSNYSNLPHGSIFRALVDHIKGHLNASSATDKPLPASVSQSLRILSSDYSKCLPPLDWSFLEAFFSSSENCRRLSVVILTKQASVSKAGRKSLEGFMKNSLEKSGKVDDFMFLYPSLPFVCNALGANVLRQFLEKTIRSSCNSSLNSESDDFDTVLTNVKLTLENKNVPEPRKALLVSQMQNIVNHIPPDHKIMKKYAEFAIVLPPKAIECISSPAAWSEVTSVKLRRSLHIRSWIALRPDSCNPLVWFNECIDAVVNMPSEQDFILRRVLEVLQKKRDIYHGDWIVELMWRTQVSTSSATSPESISVTLFLLDLFISCIVTLSGFDCFVWDANEDVKKVKTFNIFPNALHSLLALSDWDAVSHKVIEWIHSLSKWKNLPRMYSETLEQAILIMRNNKYCSEKNKWLHLFYLPTINCLF